MVWKDDATLTVSREAGNDKHFVDRHTHRNSKGNTIAAHTITQTHTHTNTHTHTRTLRHKHTQRHSDTNTHT